MMIKTLYFTINKEKKEKNSHLSVEFYAISLVFSSIFSVKSARFVALSVHKVFP